MLKENTKIFITTFTVTSLSGEEKTFPGPFIFASGSVFGTLFRSWEGTLWGFPGRAYLDIWPS